MRALPAKIFFSNSPEFWDKYFLVFVMIWWEKINFQLGKYVPHQKDTSNKYAISDSQIGTFAGQFEQEWKGIMKCDSPRSKRKTNFFLSHESKLTLDWITIFSLATQMIKSHFLILQVGRSVWICSIQIVGFYNCELSMVIAIKKLIENWFW